MSFEAAVKKVCGPRLHFPGSWTKDLRGGQFSASRREVKV